MLRTVRLFAIALLAAAVFATAASVPWSIEVAAIDGPVGYQLDRAPLWSPPPYEPLAAQLREERRAHPWPDRWVQRGETMRPPEVPEVLDAATYAREVVVDWPGTLIHLVLLLWPAALLSGVMYLLVRGRRRDPLLQWLLANGIALTIAAAVSMGLWTVGGGWGPPLVPALVSVALLGGTFAALHSLRRHANAVAAQPAGAAPTAADPSR